MENMIQTFVNKEFGTVRTLMKDGQPWFVGKDVTDALGYSKSRNAIANHVDEDDALKQGVIDSLGRTQQMTFINESGLYSLILSAKPKWLPSSAYLAIRSTVSFGSMKKRQSTLKASWICLQSIWKVRSICRNLQEKWVFLAVRSEC